MAPQAPMSPSCDTAGDSLSTALAKCSNISLTFKSQEHFLCPHFHFFSLRHLTHLTNPYFETHFETYLANSEVTALGFFLTKRYFSLPFIAFFYSIIFLSRCLSESAPFLVYRMTDLYPPPWLPHSYKLTIALSVPLPQVFPPFSSFISSSAFSNVMSSSHPTIHIQLILKTWWVCMSLKWLPSLLLGCLSGIVSSGLHLCFHLFHSSKLQTKTQSIACKIWVFVISVLVLTASVIWDAT